MAVTRERAARALDEIAQLAIDRLGRGDPQSAVDLTMISRQYEYDIAVGEMEEDDEEMGAPTITVAWSGNKADRRRLARLWMVMRAVRDVAAAGKKLTQRELWYRLKPTGQFSSAECVYKAVRAPAR